MPIMRQFFGQDTATRDSGLQAEAAVATRGLDIEAAMDAHGRWKQRLLADIRPNQGGPEEAPPDTLPREQVCRDDACALGQWIHGPGRARLGAYPGFTALQTHHRMFHHVAGNVLALLDTGKTADAIRMLDGQFEDYSQRVQADLRLLQQVLGELESVR